MKVKKTIMLLVATLVAITLTSCNKESTGTGGNGGDGGITPAGYVDLGLPSGTKWKAANETNPNDENDFYTYDEALTAFGNQLPTKEQFEELIEYCTFTWFYTKNFGIFTSTVNGNSIVLPVAGDCDCNGDMVADMNIVGFYGDYWSSTPYGLYGLYAWYFIFNECEMNFVYGSRCYGRSVRLVHN